MAKILFHCGAHKTASTHFQYNLDLNKEYLESKGIRYFKFQDYEDLYLKAIELSLKIKEKNYDVNKTVQYIKNKINKEIEGYDLAIISYEGSLGPMSSYVSKIIYPHYEELIEQYRIIFEGHEITPIFVTRNYVDYILSVYKWMLRHGRTYKLSGYIKNFKIDEIRWGKIIGRLHSTFSNVTVWTYEEYKKDPNKILYALFNKHFELVVDFKDLKTANEKRNIGENDGRINIYYSMNRLMNNRFLHTTLETRFKFNQYIIDPYFSKFINGKFFPNCLDVEIKDYFDTEEVYKNEINEIKHNNKYYFIYNK